MHQHVYRIIPGRRSGKGAQRLDQIGAVRQTRALLIHDLHLLALQDSHVGKLPKAIDAAMFDYQQSRLDVLQHKSQAGHRSRGAPNLDIIPLSPNTEMNSGTLNCRSEFCQSGRRKWQTMLEHQRLARLFWRKKGKRDFRKAALLWPEAGPESCVDDCFNGGRIGWMG